MKYLAMFVAGSVAGCGVAFGLHSLFGAELVAGQVGALVAIAAAELARAKLS